MGLLCSVYKRISHKLGHTDITAQPGKAFFMRRLEVRLGRDPRGSCGIAFCTVTSISWRVSSEEIRR